MQKVEEKKKALANKAKKVEKFKDVKLWNLTAALQKHLDWLALSEEEQKSRKVKSKFTSELNKQLRAQNSKGMSYKRKGRSGIMDNKANTVFDKFEYLLEYLEELEQAGTSV